MKITIIGWYGTETIGDRAILCGLLSFFAKVFNHFEISLGSLYPFFSERLLKEDSKFWKEITGKDLEVNIFNSKKSSELNESIRKSDLVVVGGGPLMHIEELFMVEYAFKKAKKLKKQTALLGCGIGPLFYKEFTKSVNEIALKADLIVLRDSKSKDTLLEINKSYKMQLNKDNIFTSIDPSIECILEYNKITPKANDSYITANLREFPSDYSKKKIDKYKEMLIFIKALAEKYNDNKIKLTPMHYFHSGNDDRVFLNKIAFELEKANISVQNKILTLKETINVFQNAYFNIGMRYHSIILQTIASGKNYILDYTQPQKGKISGFVSDIDDQNFYKDRYVNLQNDNISMKIINNEEKVFVFNSSLVERKNKIYLEKLRELNL
ncbi:MAG: polysaccharide pyruvyl transferase family protein [Pseudomonadota bacterium]